MFWFSLLSIVQFLALFQNSRTDIPSSQCLRCICEASTNCDVRNFKCPVNSGYSTYCGPYQITRSYWEEGNEIGYDFETCANHKACSEQVIINYMKKYSRDCNNDGVIDCDDFAAIHSLGADRCDEGRITRSEYWSVYKNACPSFSRVPPLSRTPETTRRDHRPGRRPSRPSRPSYESLPHDPPLIPDSDSDFDDEELRNSNRDLSSYRRGRNHNRLNNRNRTSTRDRGYSSRPRNMRNFPAQPGAREPSNQPPRTQPPRSSNNNGSSRPPILPSSQPAARPAARPTARRPNARPIKPPARTTRRPDRPRSRPPTNRSNPASINPHPVPNRPIRTKPTRPPLPSSPKPTTYRLPPTPISDPVTPRPRPVSNNPTRRRRQRTNVNVAPNLPTPAARTLLNANPTTSTTPSAIPSRRAYPSPPPSSSRATVPFLPPLPSSTERPRARERIPEHNIRPVLPPSLPEISNDAEGPDNSVNAPDHHTAYLPPDEGATFYPEPSETEESEFDSLLPPPPGSNITLTVSDQCLNCLCESTVTCGKREACESSQGPCGPFRITLSQWTASGEPGGGFAECAISYECSRNVMRSILIKNSTDCNSDGVMNCIDFALLYRSGVTRCENSREELFRSTYWLNFEDCFGFERK
ncbi:uncharacterized protein LOC141855370 [Brevipalpus obovatus]|uniref:uncharacterized protein LOC141855370 n=1 Tax=Brevipalpus obovatus TaxID=246614 RepID=UPI003D9F7C35